LATHLKIGILGTRGIPNRYGGFEECAEKLALGLVKKGHQVWVYNSLHHEFQGSDWQGVHIVHCKDPEDKLGTAGQFIYDLNCINDARRRGFDIVLQLGYTSSSVWWWRWPRKAINLVNMDGLEWKRSKFSKKVQAFLRRAEAWAAIHADGLIADSLAIQQYLAGKYSKTSTFIPYGASIYEHADAEVLSRYELHEEGYHLLIARMEPENNIETIIQAYLTSGDEKPLLIVGNTGNAFGTRMKETYGAEKGVRFPGAIYDATIINALRHYAYLYYHGHSVGGTNPSLLEAMGCRARIAAHRNQFNEAVLGEDAFYFSDAADIKDIILNAGPKKEQQSWLDANVQKIKDTFNWPAVIDAYEAMMLKAYSTRKNASVQPLP
jgi:glycosyltransferase involved in cell wall biosynthesis